MEKLTNWQVVFLASRVNGARYEGDGLPCYRWDWPTKTWLSERLEAKARAK